MLYKGKKEEEMTSAEEKEYREYLCKLQPVPEKEADETIFDTIMNFLTSRNKAGSGCTRIERLSTESLVHTLIEDLTRRGFLKKTGFSEAGVMPRNDEPPTSKKDQINPDHYKSHPSGIECIEVTRHMNFNCGNAVKYIWRNGLKDANPSIQELKKAAWYLNDEIKRLESENGAK